MQFLDKDVQISCRCAEAVSPVAGQRDQRPCCAVRAASQVVVQTCKNCGFPQLQFLDSLVTCPLLSTNRSWRCRRCSSCGYVRRCEYAATRCLATVNVPQTQFIAGVCGHFPSEQRRLHTVQLCMAVAAMRGSMLQFCSFFLASVHLDVEAQGGGDAGSLTLRCSATPPWVLTLYRQRHASGSTSAPQPPPPDRSKHTRFLGVTDVV